MSRSENGSVASPASHHNQQRLCHIVKRDDFDGYGFNLHSEKGKPGQYIGKVDENSPAEEAGLCQGDRIIEVNGVNIGSETHKQVVQRIKAITNEVRLLVIDPSLEKKSTTTTGSSNNKSNKTANDSPASTVTSTITVQSSTVHAETIAASQKIQPTKKSEDDDDCIPPISPVTSIKSESNSVVGGANYNNNNTINSSSNGGKTPEAADTNIPSSASSLQQQQHQNGTTSTTAAEQQQKPSTGLNLPMTAAEMRAKLLARKKYDPKNDSVDLRKKFEIIQKL